uniref:Uncharacterized protein n=1 Tax=Plectus sambesii TaxID=2011161 RepID=A0A914VYJ1_9BILA
MINLKEDIREQHDIPNTAVVDDCGRTTVIPSCSSAFPLLNADLSSPGDHAVQLIPADKAAVGETITVKCIQDNLSTLCSIVAMKFDDGMTAQQYSDSYPVPGNFFEQFTMTCTPSGL